MILNAGDKVRLLNESGEGIITKVVSSYEVWVDIDGFEYPYPIHELIKVTSDNEVQYTPKPSSSSDSSAKGKKGKKFGFPQRKGSLSHVFSQVNPRGIPEIDLHIEKLTQDHQLQLDKREALLFQMEYLKYILEEAEHNKVRELIVIHGKGEGILKAEVRKLLESLPHVEFWDGAFQFYSTGATHIKIFY